MSDTASKPPPAKPKGSERHGPELRAVLFDADFYLSRYPDVGAARIDPARHYLKHGAAEGRQPHPLFDPDWYLAQLSEPDRARSDPLGDYLRHGWSAGRSPHPLFDPQWYLRKNQDVVGSGMEPLEHFVRYGWREGRQPHPLFDVVWYRDKYAEIISADINPLVDYVTYGWRVGRKPNSVFDVAWYIDRYSSLIPDDTDPLSHYATVGVRQGLKPHALFDPEWYAQTYREVAEAGVDPLADFLARGGREGRNPNPLFDSAWYRREYPDVDAAGMIPFLDFITGGAAAGRRPNPLFDCIWYSDTYHNLGLAPVDTLTHYLDAGGFEGRKPTPLFDSGYYLKRYPDVAATGINPLVHYLEHGIRDGRFPNPLFDTGHYLRRNLDIAQGGINPLDHYHRHGGREGRDPSEIFSSSWYLKTYRNVAERQINPLEDYLTEGREVGRNPHPLFDDAYYSALYPDVADTGMLPAEHYMAIGAAEGRKPTALFDGGWYMRVYQDIRAGGLNPLVHYAIYGAWENRWPNPLFDSQWYRTRYADRLESGINPLVHYIEFGEDAGCKPSSFFEPEWYREQNPDALQTHSNLLAHYLDVGGPAERDPHPLFDSTWYTARYLTDETDETVPVAHFIKNGRTAAQKPNALFDPEWYAQRYPDIGGGSLETFAHFWEYGREEGRFPAAVSEMLSDMYGTECADRIGAYIMRYRLGSGDELPGSIEPTEQMVDAWVEEMLNLGAGVPAAAPEVSVVIPVFNHVLQTMACVHSLMDLGAHREFEIIVADDASTDETTAILGRLAGVRLVRSDTNRGFIANCNAGAEVARGRFVAFLNNDTLVLPGWLDEMVDTFDRDENIGYVGSRLLFGNGSLQEAGGILWRDGSAWNYGRGHDPRRPEFSYLRDVDYVSGASIMLPRALWKELGGFDTWYDVAYCEDSDLAFRVRAAGRRVVYQPWSVALHFEGVSSGTDLDSGVKRYQVTNGRKLFERWEKTLSTHRPAGRDPARERERMVEKRILVVDALTPAPDEDAGSVTCFELMRAFQANGYKVAFYPHSYPAFLPKQTKALQRIGIEAIYHPFYSSLEDYLKEHGSLYDIVMVFRNELAFELLNVIDEFAPRAKTIFHVSDLHFVREGRKAELEGLALEDRRTVRQSQAKEFYSIIRSDMTIVHSFFEKELIEKHALDAKVFVFPWIVDTIPSEPPFEARNGIAFLGGYRHPPNVDSVLYFADRIWPKIHAERPEMPFYVVGSHVPPEIQELDGHDNIRVLGYVEDLATCFDHVRLSVAPLRYGAGTKGKVTMAMAYGLPVIATTCGAEGMGLIDGENIVIRDDEDEFAEAVIRLHDDPGDWQRISERSLAYIDEVCSSSVGAARVKEMIDQLYAGRSAGAV